MNAKIPEDIIQEIIRRVDLLELVGYYVQLRKSGKNYVGLCPFHTEKTPSFSVSAEKQFYHCFGCGAGGNAFTFLMEMEGFTFPEAVAELGNRTGIQVHSDDDRPTSREKAMQGEKEWVIKAHQLTMQLYQHMLLERKEGLRALEYLKQRGFTIDTLKQFQVGFAPDQWDFLTTFLAKRQYPLHVVASGGLIVEKEGDNGYYDRFRGRIMFPIQNRQGQIIAFQGRIVGSGEPKYLNSPETFLFQKHRQLYHFLHSRREMRKKQTALLFEGVADVLSAYQAGIGYATATLGTALSEEQARMIGRNVEQVVICYDGDRAGTEAARKAAELLLEQGCQVRVAALPQGCDPDEYIQAHGAQRFETEIVRNAQTYTAFELRILRTGLNLQDDGDRMSYLEKALTVISRLERAVERDHYLRQLSAEFSLSLDALRREQYQIYRAQKNRRGTDKPDQKWNNSKNNRKDLVKDQLVPAYQKAEKHLLAHMMKDRQVADIVQRKIGSSFHVKEHNILAAYLYAYYAQGHQPDPNRFITVLQEQDPDRVRLASGLAAMTLRDEISGQELQDLLDCVQDADLEEQIRSKLEEEKLAEQRGDVIKAAQIAMEVVEMKNRQKNKRRDQHRKGGE